MSIEGCVDGEEGPRESAREMRETNGGWVSSKYINGQRERGGVKYRAQEGRKEIIAIVAVTLPWAWLPNLLTMKPSRNY